MAQARAIKFLLIVSLNSLFLPLPLFAQVSTPSSTDPGAKPDELDAKRLRLEQQVREVASLPGGEDSPQVRELKTQLIETTGEEAEAVQARADLSKAASNTVNVSIPILYVTERARNGNGRFSVERRPSGFEFGRISPSINVAFGVRPDFIPGAQALPQSSAVTTGTPSQFVTQRDFLDELSTLSKDKQGKRRKVFLFVHGYRVSFDDAMAATALLASEMQFPVIPVSYSWISAGTFAGYWHDADNIDASTARFSGFLRTMVARPDTDVFIVCHSMGTRIVASALSELGRNSVKVPALRQVIFAAADIPTKGFPDLWSDMHKLPGVSYSFYDSNHDLALKLSKIANSGQRVGDTTGGITIPDGATVIDASQVDSAWQAFGHSYVTNSLKVGSDIAISVDTGAPPDSRERGLRKLSHDGGYYFAFMN